MADERYQKMLGISPVDEIPTYYELLVIDTAESSEEVIEKAYKVQIRKLQAIRTSKDKGFIEFLKEELRKARRTLVDPSRRKTYDESLMADAIESFKEFVLPLMALGEITKSVFDTMVAKGVGDGLTEEQARTIIEEMAAENNAVIATEEEPEADEPEDDFYQEAPERFRPAGEVVLEAPPDAATTESQRFNRASLFYGGGGEQTVPAQPVAAQSYHQEEEEPEPVQEGPWSRPNERTAPWARRSTRAWGARRKRRPLRRRAGAAGARPSGGGAVEGAELSQSELTKLDEAIRMFNLGAKLSKIASDVHEKLRFYFPPANGKATRTNQINGVSYEKVFDTEQKMYRDTLKKLESAQGTLGNVGGDRADELRSRANQNIALVKGILDEIKQHKLRRLAGLSKQDELRAWQEFVGNRRPNRLCQMLSETG